MSFVSFSFALLFAAALAARLTVGRTKVGRPYLGCLLVLSLVFYAWHVPQYLAILLGTTSVDYVAGRLLSAPGGSTARRRAVLCVSLCCNLSILFFFKYSNFFL